MSERAPVRLYRLLLRMYPRLFRERYGAEMVADARALLAQRRAERGVVGVLSACWLIVRDLLRSAVRERRLARQARAVHPRRRGDATMLTHDVRQGVRILLRAPGFALAAVLTLGLGIGATAAIFSVMYAVVLRPLPFPEPERLVRFWELTPQGEDFSTSPPNVLDFRERSRTLESIGALGQSQVTLTGSGEPQRLNMTLVTPNVLTMLGGQPLLGRTFTPEEERPGAANRVVVISEGFWQSQFGRDPNVIGRTLTLNGATFEVVGVMPASFMFPAEQQGWMPMSLNPAASRGDHRIWAIGRLRAGATLEQASAELRAIASELGRLYPISNAGWSVRIATFAEWIIGPGLQRTMLVLQLAAGLLLLMACANVAHLLLVRAIAREREIGVRAALGASGRRIVTQLLAESLVLALVAGAVGVALAYAGVPLLMQLSPPGLPRADEVALNGMVLLFATGVTCVAGLAFGLLPALHLARPDLHAALRTGARVATQGGRHVREVLLVGEIALATMLLVGAALLFASFSRLRATDIGFNSENVLMVPVALTSRYYAGCPADGGECSNEAANQRVVGFMRAAVERLEAMPGVRRVGATNITPLAGGSTGMEIRAEGYTPANPSERAWADWRAVTAGFFEAAGLPIVRGRGITTAEDDDAAPVIVVSETLARKYWPGQDPIGKRIAFGTRGTNWQTVVGVARDMRDTQVETDPRDVAYIPYGGIIWQFMTLVIRTERDPDALINDVRRVLWSIDPALPLPDVRPLESYRSDALAASRFSLLLMAVFAGTALLLGILGVYGVTYFTVMRRTREFGVRLALGARRRAVLAIVLRGAARPIVVGVLLGLGGARLLSGVVRAMLYGTSPVDPMLYAAAGAVLAAAALCASVLPAWRATRVDPRQALAAE
jgi:putative ABC transport system permease protein